MPKTTEKRWVILWRSKPTNKWKRHYDGESFDSKRDAIGHYNFCVGYQSGVPHYDEHFKSGVAIAVRATVTTEWDSPGGGS